MSSGENQIEKLEQQRSFLTPNFKKDFPPHPPKYIKFGSIKRKCESNTTINDHSLSTTNFLAPPNETLEL